MDSYKHKLQGEIFNLLSVFFFDEELNKNEIIKILKVFPTILLKALVLIEKEKLKIMENDKKINLTKIK